MHLIITPENCIYRGEGNVGFVISLKKEEKVIRLEKQDVASEHITCAEEQRKKCENQITIVNNVMKLLLGENLVHCPTLVFIHKEDIKMLNGLFSHLRPKARIHRTVKEENSYVLMLPDYCALPLDLKKLPSVGPVISVEIKPKQGFLLKEQYAPSSPNSPLKCRFCLMQHYKRKSKVINSKNVYCPTDLFSGCPIRMQHALKMLLQFPQNNLRIFKDKELIYSEEKQSDLEEAMNDFFCDSKTNYCDLFCNLVTDVLLKALPGKFNEVVKHFQNGSLLNCTNAYSNCSQEGCCHELPIGCVLYRILCLQLLDHLHIKTLHSLYLKVKNITNESSSHIGCYSASEIPPFFGEVCKIKDETDVQYASRKVWEFLVALTAQDCSIMFVLKKCIASNITVPNPNVIFDKDGNAYLFSIAIADLDPKSLSKVEKRYLTLQSCLSQNI
ncbi:inositol-pentakisphosphate 2-kinase [Trichonephila inaurata madagascariensis]|uniref:Inositol-pentakisphosphate 2-kinase n=1 Tax=Trichonephila inaurata madagascariensis TaxID=2747483 RepID=A0A8X6IKB1_9ARAC|nr:inositol-pentakisphosphate 2-kinase [Trichonephila inaurata madagascariensis]